MMKKFHHLLILFCVTAALAQGAHLFGEDGAGIRQVDDEWWNHLKPIKETKSIRGLQDSDDSILVDFTLTEGVPNIMMQIAKTVIYRISSLIRDRPRLQLVDDFNVSRWCKSPELNGILLSEQILEVIPVYVTLMESDGVNGVVAQASPCYVYKDDGFKRTAFGILEIDLADINDNEPNIEFMESAVMHELLHILGFGVYWDGLVSTLNGGPYFLGANAALEFMKLSGNPNGARGINYIPLEASNSSKSAGAHWRSSVFGNEMMTAASYRTKCVFSKMTAKALEDIGYSINYHSPTIEPYTLPK